LLIPAQSKPRRKWYNITEKKTSEKMILLYQNWDYRRNDQNISKHGIFSVWTV
jgi:hypothetical protein